MNVPPVRIVQSIALWCMAVFLFPGRAVVQAADFEVTAAADDVHYTINGALDPELTLVRGRTYTFHIDACFCHPMVIVGAAGAVENNNTFSGTITFHVPLTVRNYTYVCAFHPFGGTIRTIDPPALSALELWRQTHFGTTANTGDAADLFDFDQDGLTNLVEFAFGLDPKLGSSLQLPDGQWQGGNFVVTFPQPAGVDGITFGVEWSDTTAGESWTPIPDSGTAGQHTFSVQTSGRTRLLVRLTVVRPPG